MFPRKGIHEKEVKDKSVDSHVIEPFIMIEHVGLFGIKMYSIEKEGNQKVSEFNEWAWN